MITYLTMACSIGTIILSILAIRINLRTRRQIMAFRHKLEAKMESVK